MTAGGVTVIALGEPEYAVLHPDPLSTRGTIVGAPGPTIALLSASVGIAIARNAEEYNGVEDAGGFGLFMLRMIAVPMVLHGFYDTLLKKDMNVWALVVALMSFAWFAWHIELARRTHPGAGRPGVARRAAAR